MTSAVFGSVSHKIIHHAGCPVLVAKEREAPARSEAGAAPITTA